MALQSRLLTGGIVIFLFFVNLYALLTGNLEGIEAKTLDWRYRFQPARNGTAKVAIVLITDDCLARFGGWPISREVYAGLVDRLASAGARLIAFDLLFDDPSRTDPKGDDLFVRSCQSFGKIVLPMVFLERQTLDLQTLSPVFEEEVRFPFGKLASAAAGLGFINADFKALNADGVLRKAFVSHRFQEAWYPGFALAMAEVLLGSRADYFLEDIHFDKRRIPALAMPPLQKASEFWNAGSARGILIRYLGNPSASGFPIIPLSEVMEGRAKSDVFQGASVLVGPGAIGLGDLWITPFGLSYGVLIHAQMLNNILEGEFLQSLSFWQQSFVMVLFSFITYGFLTVQGYFVLATLTFSVLLLAYFGLCFFAFSTLKVAFPMAGPLLMSFFQYITGRFEQLYFNLKEANDTLKEQNIHLARTNESLDSRVQELLALHQAGSRFPAILDLKILASEILDTFCDLRKTSDALLILFEPGADHLQALCKKGLSEVGEETLTEYPEFNQSLSTLRETKGEISLPGAFPFTTYFPLLSGGKCWGAVCLRDPDIFNGSRKGKNFWDTLLGISCTALENARLFEMTKEVTLAREVQKSLLPKVPLRLGEYQVFGFSRPATQLGGDYFDYFSIGDRYLLVLIADVMGHGIPAALGMTMMKTAVLQNIQDPFVPEDFVRAVNKSIYQGRSGKIMITALFLVTDTHLHQTTLFHCGHIDPAKRSPEGKLSLLPMNRGVPLGRKISPVFPETRLPLLLGELLYFFTDGLVESLSEDSNPEKDCFGAFLEYLSSRPLKGLHEACEDILDHHPCSLSGRPQPDDFTVLILERRILVGGNHPSEDR